MYKRFNSAIQKPEVYSNKKQTYLTKIRPFQVQSSSFAICAMAIWLKNATELSDFVREKSDEIYKLLVAAARPVLDHGTEEEVPGLKLIV